MWVQLAWAVVSMIVSYAISASMAPKPERPKAGKLDVPGAEEGGSIPVIFGTVIVKKSNVIWYGNATTIPIVTKGGKK